MAKELARTIILQDPETRRYVAFAAGEVPPSWAAEQITNGDAWGDKVEADVAEAAESGAPTRSASKADWKAYAIAQGMDEDQADDMTRDDLAELYLGG